MPTESFKSDDFQYVIGSTLGIFYIMSFLYPVSRIIRGLVLEKEYRIKEGMKMMGLTDTIYNSSWFITTFIQMTIISVLITGVSSTTVFAYSNKLFVFLYFEVFSLAVMNLCFLLATLFSKSKTAALMGPMIFFASFFPYYAVNDPQFDSEAKTTTCLLAPACFALGANVFADYEGGLVGVQFENVNQPTSNFTYNLVVGMLFLDAVLYGVLAWYLDKVIPSEFGTPLPFYFPFLPSYWCGSSPHHHDLSTEGLRDKEKHSSSTRDWFRWKPIATTEGEGGRSDKIGNVTDMEANESRKSIASHYYEMVSSEFSQQIQEEKCLSIQDLRRVFTNPAGGDERIAVNGLNLDLFQNQVTVLLGHNGAGKSTVINMLVGMISPTSGTAVFPGGLDMNTEMATIRRGLGVCPQHDILFPQLTALQHLQVTRFALSFLFTSFNVSLLSCFLVSSLLL
jgi:ATP-binding cassette subfamily A (ABC1) protein 3